MHMWDAISTRFWAWGFLAQGARQQRLGQLGHVGAGVLSVAMLILLLSGCGGEPKKSKDAAVANAAERDVSADVTARADSALDSLNPDSTGDSVDSGGLDAVVEEVDTDVATVKDVGSLDVGPQCSQASDCAAVVKPRACEEAVCEAGSCGLKLKANTCCEDKHCDDGIECTTDQCDSGNNACKHLAVVNCCSGKVSLLKLGFEKGTLGTLQPLVAKGGAGAGPGAVSWQVSAKRTRIGGKALHLSNSCGTYDTSMDVANGCVSVAKGTKGKDPKAKPAPGPTPVSATLLAKGITLPKDKSTLLHFWLWLDAEPMYANTLPKGVCAKPCPEGASCVSVNGAAQCIPEKDVLTVTILSDKGSVKVFDSTDINKTTAGKWRHIAIDLSDFAGNTVGVRWRFDTGTGIKNGFEGVWLDEIVMETVCPVKGTLCAKDAPCLVDNSVCSEDQCTFYSNNAVKGFCFHDAAVGCCTVANECDDGLPCTLDTCNKGVCETKPDASKTSCCKPSIGLVDDFDSGVLSDWQLLDSNSKIARWQIRPKAGIKGSQALYFGNAAATGYEDSSLGKGVGAKGAACSKPVKLKIGTLYNQLTFQLKMETEWSYLPKAIYKNPPLAGQPKFDHLAVQVRVGGKVSPAWSSNLIYGTTDGKWRSIVVDLDGWQGKEVQICVAFDAGDDQVNDKAGVLVDDFIVRVACKKKSCYFDAECTGACPSCQAPGCGDAGCGCVPLPGCCTATTDCDDSNPCTLDACVQAQCKHTVKAGCCNVDSECSSTDPCAKAICDSGTNTCKNQAVKGCCTDDKACSTDVSCMTSTCDVAKSVCVEKAIAGCCDQDAVCDDKDACTKDLCLNSKCSYQPSGKAGCK